MKIICVLNMILQTECVVSTTKKMQAGYTVTVHKADGTTVTKEVMLKEGTVVLEPDVRAYFPDSESVNRALRCLIPLLPEKPVTKTNKACSKDE